MAETFQYCLKHSILGVGWRAPSLTCTKDWDTYTQEADPIHGKGTGVYYIKKWIQPDDLVWTRDVNGQYYLARVLSGWEYWTTPEAEEQDLDVANIFRCEILPIEIGKVPGKVVACFRPTRSTQEICDSHARVFSQFLWNQSKGIDVYPIDPSLGSDLFMLLDSEELEDVIFLYLQYKGWFVVPNSRKGDTMSFEYLAVDPKTGRQAVAQVKSGKTPIHQEDYHAYAEDVFLFQAHGHYHGVGKPNITCIAPKEIEDFVAVAYPWLPSCIRLKIDLGRTIKGTVAP
jgi:hypothetical protein